MSKSTCAVLVLFVLTLVPHSWAVPNAVVGTCVAGKQFTTIQGAIDAADIGSTVRVCPGTYPEILTITKDINVRGITSGTAASVFITVPSTGVPQNASSGLLGSLAVQVLVQNATVNLSYLNIDGTHSGACAPRLNQVGVLFQAAVGSMTNSSFVGAPNCNTPVSAFIDLTTNFNFSNNYLRECPGICVEVDYGTNTTVKNNDLLSLMVNAVSGIEMQNLGGPATVSGNTISGNMSSGVSVFTSPSVTVTNNTVTLPGGIGFVLSDATQSVVETNRAFSLTGVTVINVNGPANNTVSKNTLGYGNCGLGLSKTDKYTVVTPNTYLNTTATICRQ